MYLRERESAQDQTFNGLSRPGAPSGTTMNNDHGLWASITRQTEVLTHLILMMALWNTFYYYFHFTDEEAEAQRSEVAGPMSHS